MKNSLFPPVTSPSECKFPGDIPRSTAAVRLKPLYRGTSLIRKYLPLGPYSSSMPRALWWWVFSCERFLMVVGVFLSSSFSHGGGCFLIKLTVSLKESVWSRKMPTSAFSSDVKLCGT